MSQWRVGGQLNVRHTWPLPQLNACLCLSVVPLQFWESLSLCLQRLSLCQKYCTCHLAWLHICGYPVYKDRKTALFMQQSFAQQLFTLRSTCRNSKPFSHAKERNTLVVPSVDNCMLLITCCHPVCSHKDGCCSALVVAPYTISQFTHFLAICVAKDKSVTELCL